MSSPRPLVLLLVPALLVGCDKPSDPVEPQATVAPAPASRVATPPGTAADVPTQSAVNDPAVANPVAAPVAAARIVLMPTSGNQAHGDLSLVPEPGSLRLTGTLTGLGAESVHGFHVHEIGDCSAPDATSAGPHFNPAGHAHGEPGSGEHHLGDLPNVTANAQGIAAVNLRLPGLELGSNSPHDVLGRALVLHAQRDDYRSQPAGDSGARIACGVIQRATDVAGAASRLPSDLHPSDAQSGATTPDPATDSSNPSRPQE